MAAVQQTPGGVTPAASGVAVVPVPKTARLSTRPKPPNLARTLRRNQRGGHRDKTRHEKNRHGDGSKETSVFFAASSHTRKTHARTRGSGSQRTDGDDEWAVCRIRLSMSASTPHPSAPPGKPTQIDWPDAQRQQVFTHWITAWHPRTAQLFQPGAQPAQTPVAATCA